MNKYYETLTNTAGDILPGHRVQVLDSGGSTVTIYADSGGTRFTDGSGNNVNYATADSESGLAEFYWTAANGQTLQILDAGGNLVLAIADFANNYSDPDAVGNVDAVLGVTASDGDLGTFTGSTISDDTTVKGALQELETSTETKTTATTLAGTGGAALVGTADSETVEGRLGRYQAANIAAIEALTPVDGDTAYLREAGKEGAFVFSTSNFATEVTADTEQGVYIAPTSDATGASGAWVRQFESLKIDFFGVSSTNTNSANRAALQAAVNEAQRQGIPLDGSSLDFSINSWVTINPALGGNFVNFGNVLNDSTSRVFDVVQEDADAVASSTVTADVEFNSSLVQVASTTGMVAGQLAFILSDTDMPDQAGTVFKMQMAATIAEVVDATNIRLTYLSKQTITGGTVTIKTFNVKPVVIEANTLRGTSTTLLEENKGIVKCYYADNVSVKIRDYLESDDLGDYRSAPTSSINGVVAIRSTQVRFTGNMRHLKYGFLAQQGSGNCVYDDGRVEFTRHANNFAGGSHLCRVKNVHASRCYGGFDSHQAALDSYFENCTESGTVSLNSKFRGRHNEHVGCEYLGYEGEHDINLLPATSAITDAEWLWQGEWLYRCTVHGNGLSSRLRSMHKFHCRDVNFVGWFWNANQTASFVEVIDIDGFTWTPGDVTFPSDLAFLSPGTVETILKNGVAQGADYETTPSDLATSRKMFFYIQTVASNPGSAAPMTFENVEADGFRAGIYSAASDLSKVKLRNFTSKHNGAGFQNASGTDMIIGETKGLTLSDNFSDFENVARVLAADNDYYDLRDWNLHAGSTKTLLDIWADATISNRGRGVNILTYTLPASTADNIGSRFHFIAIDSGDIRVNPDGTEEFIHPDATGAGKYVAVTQGSSITVELVNSGEWAIIAQSGAITWEA